MAWIRSQDKYILIYCTDIRVVENNIWVNSVTTILGTFSTREAALAELDCIERWVATGTTDVYQIMEEKP